MKANLENIGEELDDNYPVYWDYVYVVDENIIRSDIQGTILDLKRDLRQSFGMKANKIFKYKFKD